MEDIMSRYERKADFMPEDRPGEWESGKTEGPVTHHYDIVSYDTADVRDSDGELHEDVTVIPRDDKE